ncbi:phosphonate metabolism transcriptional regulator PhnF [Muricoccus nepalensis]|nr:phosphonate metabolism transcriptional regulator PhnF [Roseomonas nepalensis]
MTKTSLPADWRTVETCLTAEIRNGRLSPGEQLPPEPALMARFAVGRHSVRRALAALQTRGLVQTLQGSGTYVRRTELLGYRLSERTRFSRNLLDQGREPSARFLRGAELVAPPEVAEVLDLPPGARAYNILRLGFADAVPINLSNAWYPARRFPGLLEACQAGGGASEVLAAHGVDDYLRLRSTIVTRLPTADEASWLDQPATHPVLVVRKVDADLSGVPITCSETVWAGERVQLLVDNERPPESKGRAHQEMTDVDR